MKSGWAKSNPVSTSPTITPRPTDPVKASGPVALRSDATPMSATPRSLNGVQRRAPYTAATARSASSGPSAASGTRALTSVPTCVPNRAPRRTSGAASLVLRRTTTFATATPSASRVTAMTRAATESVASPARSASESALTTCTVGPTRAACASATLARSASASMAITASRLSAGNRTAVRMGDGSLRVPTPDGGSRRRSPRPAAATRSAAVPTPNRSPDQTFPPLSSRGTSVGSWPRGPKSRTVVTVFDSPGRGG